MDEAPEPDEALPWLYRISYLTVSNHWRSVRRRIRLQEKVTALGVVPPEPVADQVVVREEVREVVALLDHMRPADAEVLRLAAWEHLGAADIGAVLGISTDAAKQRLSRARKRLTRMHEKADRTERRHPPLLGKEVHGEQ